MSRIQLRRLPETRNWSRVSELLADPNSSPGEVAGAVTSASDRRMRQLVHDRGVIYCFWLLARIPQIATDHDFYGQLAILGLHVTPDTPTLGFLSLVDDSVRNQISESRSSGDFAEYASLALRSTLTWVAGQNGHSIFESTVQDLQGVLVVYAEPRRFADISSRFFGDFFARTVRSFVERDISNHVGEGHRFEIAEDSWVFLDDLESHSRRAAGAARASAFSWYIGLGWNRHQFVALDEIQDFIEGALREIRTELKRSVR